MRWIRFTFIAFLFLIGLSFVSLVVYANLEKPTLGEQIYFENPTEIVVFKIDENCESETVDQIITQTKQLTGVYSQVYTSSSKTLCLTFDPRETCRKSMLTSVKDISSQISERADLNSRPECPVDHTLIQKMIYTLNFR